MNTRKSIGLKQIYHKNQGISLRKNTTLRHKETHMKSRGEETIAACEGKCFGGSKRNKYNRGFKFSFEAVKNRGEKERENKTK